MIGFWVAVVLSVMFPFCGALSPVLCLGLRRRSVLETKPRRYRGGMANISWKLRGRTRALGGGDWLWLSL